LGGSTSHIALRFAAISVVAVTAIAGLAAWGGYQRAGAAEQVSAARSADRLVGTPLRSALSAMSPGASNVVLPQESRTKLDALTGPLLSSDLRGVRLWTADGQIAYEAGDAGGSSKPPAVHGSDVAWSRSSATDGTRLFVTYGAADGYVIDIAQDARSIDARIASAQQETIVSVAIAYVLLCAVLQAGFWLATRKVAAEHRRLVRLFASGEDLRSSLDLHDVITQVSRGATNVARADYSLVALFEPETGDMLLRATYDATSDTVSHQQRSIEDWFLRRAVITNTTIVSGQSAKAYEQFFGPELDKYQQVNALIAPMSLRDHVVGVLAVIRVPTARRNAFTALDVRQAVDLAAQGAVAIEQSMLFSKVRSYAKEVELSYDSTLKAMMAALDAKDELTEGHCERVAKMTVTLARQMGVPDAALVDMERGALLHDVGKIGVPDEVLKKPAALNDMEWEAMRKHPLLAGMMVSKVGFLEGATPILLYHHERFDGGGYPFGLSGDKIPLDARIFSVIDAYEAMTSDRPYRDAMTHEQAMAEVAAGSGTQFDPDVVVAFNHLMASRPELRTRPAGQPDRATYHSDDVVPLPREADSSAA
jgi:HD-GYP domain-containing protein (c-di-GMP phosphodiesterase class II)